MKQVAKKKFMLEVLTISETDEVEIKIERALIESLDGGSKQKRRCSIDDFGAC